MFRWLWNLWNYEHEGDLSKHRRYTLMYEDLCK